MALRLYGASNGRKGILVLPPRHVRWALGNYVSMGTHVFTGSPKGPSAVVMRTSMP